MEPLNKKNKILIGAGIAIIIIGALVGIFYKQLFGAPQANAEPERFVVMLDENILNTIGDLKDKGFIRSSWAFGIVLHARTIEPGGYKVSKSMNAAEVASVLTSEPYMKWIVVPEGWRKEQIADLLSETLGWTAQEKHDWITKYTAPDPDHTEGVYFPDTYLIPVDESPSDVAQRFRTKFEEKFAPYAKDAVSQNIRWPTVLKIASLIQREAAGKADMPIIAGIIWNRLDQKMKLDIDATLQYIKGKSPNWWGTVSVEDKNIDSPFNTYKYAGLPPRPIANPGLDAINAVLHPAETDCIYYLHDSGGQIHCAKTYDEHKANIDKYLR